MQYKNSITILHTVAGMRGMHKLRACVSVSVCACVRACVRVCVCVCVQTQRRMQ